MWIVHLTILSAVLLSISYAWVLQTNVADLVPGGPTDLQMECKHNQTATNVSVKNAVVIRITKLDKSGKNLILANIAVPNNAQKVSTNENLQVTGQIIQGDQAILKLTFSNASQGDYGTYGCEVGGFNQQQTFVILKVASLAIKEKTFTMSEVNKIMSENNCQSSGITATRTTTTAATTTAAATTTTTTRATTTTKPTIQWPSGGYGLVEPISGCPNPQPGMKLSIQNSSIHLDNQAKFLLGITVKSRRLSYCMMDVKATGRAWPKGDYCIAYSESSGICPIDFTFGEIRYKHEVENSCKLHHLKPLYHSQKFCCRSDGPSTQEINLPTEKPFYLYRFEDDCQSVAGMTFEKHVVEVKSSRCAHRLYNEGFFSRRTVLQAFLCYYQPKGTSG